MKSLNTLDKTHYTTAQAAEVLGKTTGRIRQMARAEQLPGAEVFGTGYIIPRSVIDKMKVGHAAADDSPQRQSKADVVKMRKKTPRSRKRTSKRGGSGKRTGRR